MKKAHQYDQHYEVVKEFLGDDPVNQFPDAERGHLYPSYKFQAYDAKNDSWQTLLTWRVVQCYLWPRPIYPKYVQCYIQGEFTKKLMLGRQSSKRSSTEEKNCFRKKLTYFQQTLNHPRPPSAWAEIVISALFTVNQVEINYGADFRPIHGKKSPPCNKKD